MGEEGRRGYFNGVCVCLSVRNESGWVRGGTDYSDTQPLYYTTTAFRRTSNSAIIASKCNGWNIPEQQADTTREQQGKQMRSEGSS